MKEIKKDKDLVAFCGLYCGTCKKYLRDKCLGCSKNEKAGWCKIRKCCIKNNYNSCADCETIKNLDNCRNLNNFFAKFIGFILRSDKVKYLNRIKEVGYEEFAKEMANKNK